MSTYGMLVWTCWLLFFAGSFAVFETWALMTKGLTLSQATYDVSEKWQPIIFIWGALTGGLVVHFYWHWVPKGAPTDGG